MALHIVASRPDPALVRLPWSTPLVDWSDDYVVPLPRGLSLDEIETALSTLPSNRTPTKADWSRLSRGWRPRLDAQIAQLERLRDTLDSCIGCGCLSLRRCSLSNPDDVAAERGPGAVFLEGR